MLFDVNTFDDENLPTKWWRPVQWGERGQLRPESPCGLTECDHSHHKPYRYFLAKLPIWWYLQDAYSGKGTVHRDGSITYTRVWERLSILWTPWPGWRWHWERARLVF